VSKVIKNDCIPSTSSRDEFTTSTTSPTCDVSQDNNMVSGDQNCNVDSELTFNELYLYLIVMLRI
jgi:hypothetical protein